MLGLLDTIAAGELPLAPRVTPAWAVAGVILLGAGVIYALIGVKMKRLHTFLSAAFLAGLGTTVLIIYVMTPPISDALQGGYFVAIVCTGLILGGAAMVFPEITEGLGCLLGGFCLSMWLLTLHEGGLLAGTSAKVVFIVCLSLAALSLYFSRWTRTYALIGCISFAGATAATLGVDCFSRAGLKEFWAYIWALNDNIFPLGADTYPLTRGIRVELAATMIICLAGIVSQMKLWRIVQEHRAKRDAARAEGSRHLQEEDESAGRQVEEANARERGQWEAVYGDGEHPPPTSPKYSADSGVGDMKSEKKMRQSHTGTSGSQSDTAEPIEMSDLARAEGVPPTPPKFKAAAEVVMVQDKADGMVTVRVARDDVPEVSANEKSPAQDIEEKQVWIMGADGEARLATREEARRISKENAPPPNIIPLPFKVPAPQDGEGQDGDDDRSSVATFADEDDRRSVAVSRHGSLAKRLSQGSADLLRSLSQRSKRSHRDQTKFPSESREDLVQSRASERDDAASIGATVDNMSLSDEDEDEDNVATVHDDDNARSAHVEINAQLAETEPPMAAQPPKNTQNPARNANVEASSPTPLNNSEIGETTVPTSPVSGATGSAEKTDATATEETAGTTAEGGASAGASDEDNMKAKSVVSVDSTPASLTKERLPRSLSRIAMSFRTNEWAKHLSHAETPEPESLQLGEYPGDAVPEGTADGEEAAPVNTEELQQTAENAAPPPAAPRNISGVSNSYHSMPPAQPLLSRSNSRQSTSAVQVPEIQVRNSFTAVSSPVPSPTNPYASFNNPYRNGSGTANRRLSGILVEPIAEENDEPHAAPASPKSLHEGSTSSGRSSLGAAPADRPVSTISAGRPPVPGVISYSSPQTLIGKREMFLRNKSQGSLATSVNSPAPTPEPINPYAISPQLYAGDAGSLYNYPAQAYAAASTPALAQVADTDDLPMSHRKELLRQSSAGLSYSPSYPSLPGPTSTDALPFNSHQPNRGSKYVPTAVAREARLANFRSSVAMDLRGGVPAATGRDTPIDMQRSYLMGQKDAEVTRRETERAEKERNDRAFEERMRRGDLLEAHRDAIRRMQASTKEG